MRQNGLEYAGRLMHGGYQGFESPRLHDLREVLLSGTYHSTKNRRLPYDLGAFDLDGTVLRRDLTWAGNARRVIAIAEVELVKRRQPAAAKTVPTAG